MALSKAILHIGMHKTGSTSIQRVLHENAARLEKQGLCYPTFGTRWWGHHPIAWAAGVVHPSASEDDDADALVERYIAGATGKTLVLSSEDFFGVPNPAASEVLARVVNESDHQCVVMYIRHPVDWVVSGFKWNAEKYPERFSSIADYIAKANLPGWFNFSAVVDRWRKLPNVEFRIRPYSVDVVQDFCNLIGASGLPPAPRANSSVRGLAARVSTRLAALCEEGIPPDITATVNRLVSQATDQDVSLLDHTEYLHVLNLARGQLSALCEQFPSEGLDVLLRDCWEPGALSAKAEEQVVNSVLSQLSVIYPDLHVPAARCA